MRKEKRVRTTVSVRLTDEEHKALRRLCALKKTSQTGYLADLAKSQARKELVNYAVEEYRNDRASLSELARKTGLDVPSIMDEVAKVTGEDKRAVDGFLAAVKTLSELNKDMEFYRLAVKAIAEIEGL
jgi:hypothetical protein